MLGLPKCFRPDTINQYNKTKHPLRQNLPHKIKTSLSRSAKQVKDQVVIYRDAAKIHGYGSLLLNPFRIAGDFSFSGDNVNLADAADKFSLPGTKGTRDDHFYGLHRIDLPHKDFE